MYNLVIENPTAAKEQLQQYVSSNIPDNVKSLMQQVIDSPSTVKSMLDTVSNQLPSINDDASWYKPIKNFGEESLYITTKVAGFGMELIGDISRLLSIPLRSGTNALNEKMPNPITSRMKDAMNAVDSNVDWILNTGKSLEDKGTNWLNDARKNRLEQTEKATETGPMNEENSHQSASDN